MVVLELRVVAETQVETVVQAWLLFLCQLQITQEQLQEAQQLLLQVQTLFLNGLQVRGAIQHEPLR